MTAPLLTFSGKDGVLVDLDQLIVSRALIQANSGGGKSRAIRYLCEQTQSKVQQIILDSEGEFATLREKFPYLLIGKEGEAASDVGSARFLPRKLLELEVSTVIDLSEMGLPVQRHYVANFIQGLMQLPRELWKDCLIIIDEAHVFAPQRQKKGSTTDSLEAIERLLSAGRKRGFCAVLATQRLAKLDKDVAGECLNKLIGRTSFDDSKRAGEELGQQKGASRELVSLEPGHFWAYGPAIGIDPVLIRTGDVATAPPKRGTSRAPAPATPAAIKAILSELADLPKQAADEERTTQEMRREILDLRRKLSVAEKAGPERIVEKKTVDQGAIDRAVASAVTSERRRIVKEIRAAHTELSKHVVAVSALPNAMGKVAAIALDLESRNATQPVASAAARQPVISTPRGAASTNGNTPRRAAPEPRESVYTSNGTISGVGQKILDTLGGLESLGVENPDKATVAALVGYHMNSKGYANAIGSLRSGGYVDYPAGGRIALTDAGRAIAGNHLQVSSHGELHELWYDRLGGVSKRILEPLIEIYPSSMDAATLAAQADYHPNSKSFANAKGRLRTLGLIDYPNSGQVAATKILFPEGLPS